MTIRRLGSALAILSLGVGCASGENLTSPPGETGGAPASSGGGSTKGGTSGTTDPTGGGASSTPTGTGGASATPQGGTGTTTGTGTKTSTGGSGTTATTAGPTPTTCGTPSGELTVAHVAQSGGSGVTGNTTITPGTAASFSASEIKLKYCFETIGDVPASLTAAAMKVYHASVEGGPAYVELTTSTISTEKPSAKSFCFVFDPSTVTAAAGVTVTSPAAVKYNWSLDTSKVDGLMIDSRAGHEPTLIVLRGTTVAACVAVPIT